MNKIKIAAYNGIAATVPNKELSPKEDVK